MPIESELVVLRGGLVVPMAPLQLVWALTERGLSVDVDGDDLVIRPAGQLTQEERRDLARWKADVRTLLAYSAPEAVS